LTAVAVSVRRDVQVVTRVRVASGALCLERVAVACRPNEIVAIDKLAFVCGCHTCGSAFGRADRYLTRPAATPAIRPNDEIVAD
jgi:hypothetical protein